MKKDKKLRKTLASNIFHDIKIIKTTTGKYYLCISTDEKIENPKLDANNVTSCDPGQKTFQTSYNPKEILEIGKNIDVEVGKIHDRLSNLRKKLKELIKKKKKYRTTSPCNMEYKKLHEKLRNKIIDMHNKAIIKLLEYDIIYLPRLNTKKIVEQKTYHKKSKKILNSLAHGSFIRRIINKAKLKGKKVIICSEHLTTQLCSGCFSKNNIGNSRTYNCLKCGYKAERDIQSSKLILMKQIATNTQDTIKDKIYATLS
jgi:transposase